MFWLKGQRSAQIFGRGIKFIAPQKNLPAHSKHTCPVGVSIRTESNRAALAACLLRNGGHQQQPHTHSFPLRCFGNNLTPWHTLSERTFPFSLPLVTATSPTHAARLRSSPPTQPSGRAGRRPGQRGTWEHLGMRRAALRSLHPSASRGNGAVRRGRRARS